MIGNTTLTRYIHCRLELTSFIKGASPYEWSLAGISVQFCFPRSKKPMWFIYGFKANPASPCFATSVRLMFSLVWISTWSDQSYTSVLVLHIISVDAKLHSRNYSYCMGICSVVMVPRMPFANVKALMRYLQPMNFWRWASLCNFHFLVSNLVLCICLGVFLLSFACLCVYFSFASNDHPWWLRSMVLLFDSLVGL